VNLVIICTVSYGILQVLAKQYIKSHLEFLMDPHIIRKLNLRPKFHNWHNSLFGVEGFQANPLPH